MENNNLNKIKKLMNLTEAVNIPLPTPFMVVSKKSADAVGREDITFRFRSDSGEAYILNFFIVSEPNFIKINNKLITSISTANSPETPPNYAHVVVPNYDLVNRPENEKDTNTGLHEQYEILCRVLYLLGIFIINYPQYNIFQVCTNTEKKRLNIYEKLFYDQHYIDKFDKYEGLSENCDGANAFYFIKK